MLATRSRDVTGSVRRHVLGKCDSRVPNVCYTHVPAAGRLHARTPTSANAPVKEFVTPADTACDAFPDLTFPLRMTESSDAPLADPVGYDDEEKYLVHGEYAIRQILQSLIDKRALVSGCAMPRNHTFPTSVIEVLEDEDGVLIDGSAAETINRSIEEASHVTCVSRLERIHVQFKLYDLQRVQKDGQVAFRAPLPESVLRLQRREFYRLQVPVTQPMDCEIPTRHPDGETTYRTYRVLDISGGGIALAVQAEEPTLQPYKEFAGCLLHLPDSGPLSVRLMVKSLHRQLNQNGSESWRAGCQFTDMPRGGDALIQRYIFRLERQRSARERGAA